MKEYKQKVQELADAGGGVELMRMFGEETARGFRGNMGAYSDEQTVLKQPNVLTIGDYALWGRNGDLWICQISTGQMGTFKKEEFETHIAAFFGLNY